jgi:hypothetical protein
MLVLGTIKKNFIKRTASLEEHHIKKLERLQSVEGAVVKIFNTDTQEYRVYDAAEFARILADSKTGDSGRTYYVYNYSDLNPKEVSA